MKPENYSIDENLTCLYGIPAYVQNDFLTVYDWYALFTKTAIYIANHSNYARRSEGDQLLCHDGTVLSVMVANNNPFDNLVWKNITNDVEEDPRISLWSLLDIQVDQPKKH